MSPRSLLPRLLVGLRNALEHVTELVPGDVLALRLGDLVPADLRLLEVSQLECDEGVLTGESMPVPKTTNPVVAPVVPVGLAPFVEGVVLVLLAVTVVGRPTTAARRNTGHALLIPVPR